MQNSWVAPIKNLCDILLGNEQSIQLLRDIDAGMRAVLANKRTIDDLLTAALESIHNILAASATHFYLLYRAYEDAPLHVRSIPNRVSPSGAKLSNFIANTAWERATVLNLSPSMLAAANYALSPGTEAVVLALVPMPDQGIVGVLVMESPNPLAFHQESISTLLGAVAEQLSSLFHLYENWRRRETTAHVLATFLDKKLKPNQCLQSLAEDIPHFMPDFGPFRLQPAPRVQILFYREGDRYLTIRATTGSEPPITRVDISRSVCGYLVEDQTLPYFLCDPATEPRYASYLGKLDNVTMRSEVAVAVKYDGKLIAVLNLESPALDAFLPQHIDAAIATAGDLASWIVAIRDRIDVGFAKEEALGYVMEDYVTGHGRMLSHSVGNKLTGLVVTLDNLVRETRTVCPEISERLQAAHQRARSFRVFLRDFINDPKDAAKQGPQNLRGLVQDAIDLIKDLQAKVIDQNAIEFVFPEDQADYEVFCSKLFRQHIYNLVPIPKV
jgi:putative methionine-R-sulfoxide reductase with GAF domain